MKAPYMSGAEPFFHYGNHVGCLLLHGFTGTPNEMRELGTRLKARGYTVTGPALAGHASRIEDMLPTRWDDWYRTATDAYDQLAQTCHTIFPIGLSLGGALALHLAAHRPVSGAVAVSAPASVDNWRMLPLRLLRPLFRFIPTIKKNLKRSDAQDPKLYARRLRYMAYPTAAAASMIRDFFPHVMDDLKDVRAPALLIQPRGDQTIPRRSMETIHAKLGSREKDMVWLERGGHQALEDLDKEIAFEHIARFIQRHVPTPFANPTELRPSVSAEPATR
jgi:carboxylesterase